MISTPNTCKISRTHLIIIWTRSVLTTYSRNKSETQWQSRRISLCIFYKSGATAVVIQINYITLHDITPRWPLDISKHTWSKLSPTQNRQQTLPFWNWNHNFFLNKVVGKWWNCSKVLQCWRWIDSYIIYRQSWCSSMA